MVMAKGFVAQKQLADAVDAIRPALGPDVVRMTYVLGEDWSGEPAIFFRVVISDRASERSGILSTTGPIREKIVDQLRPLEEWGLAPYFTFRSASEQAANPDDVWP